MLSNVIKNPKKKKNGFIIGGVLLLIIIAGVNIFMMQGKQKKTVAEVRFEKVTERNFNNSKLISGQVKPGNIESFYTDSTKGTVKNIEVKEGEQVTKGTKLFSYDNEEMNLKIKQAEIDRKIASMRYEQGKKKIDLLKSELKKTKDSGAGKDVLDPLEAQLSELESQQKTAELEKEKGELQINELQKSRDELTIYSKFSGVVQKLDKDAAQASTQTMNGQGNSFLQIASTDPYQIEGTLTEIQKSQILKDQTFIATAKANGQKKWTGKIIEVSEFPISAEISTAAVKENSQNTAQYTYKAILDGQEGLSPGYHVSLQVNLENKKGPAISSKCIVEKGNDLFVYIESYGKIHKQNVKKGATDGEWIEIIEGLKANQKVVKDPSDELYDGMEVKGK
ncbi:TPA: efflux RND transporter periplasmic adaptor subunit [Bacillus cereus]